MGWNPGYVSLLASGELAHRANLLRGLLSPCRVCPCRCEVDRHGGLGRCATPAGALVASWAPHFGEEPPLSGSRGSGTIFLANCNLRCVYCQNHDISQAPKEFIGAAQSAETVAAIMLKLQREGCHNINWVSPSHQVPALVQALAVAAQNGLSLPIVYNTNAYDSVEVLRLLDGIVDIYLPDLKYADEHEAARLSRVGEYPRVARAALAEMYRQIGPAWEENPDGTLRRGILVRLLILPGGLAGVEESIRWLSEALSPAVAVSLMSQYRPAHFGARSGRFPELARRISADEHRRAVEALVRFNRSEHTYVQP